MVISIALLPYLRRGQITRPSAKRAEDSWVGRRALIAQALPAPSCRRRARHSQPSARSELKRARAPMVQFAKLAVFLNSGWSFSQVMPSAV